MASYYNCFDTETGGLEVKYALLTLYFAVFDMEFNFLEELDIATGPSRDVGDFKVTKKAMEINKINLEEHVRRPDFLTYDEAAAKLRSWCQDMKAKLKPGRSKLFLPLGQNLGFDLKFIHHYLVPIDEFEEYFHYNIRDTLSNAVFLGDAGIMPKGYRKLGDLVDYFGLKMEEAHVAKDDVRMTARVYRKQLDLLKGVKNQMSGIPADVLRIIEG